VNKEIIHSAIKNPQVLSESSIRELLAVSEQFPYFGAAQVLLTKAFRDSNDHRFTDQLHQAALYSGDRTKLYYWLKKEFVKPIATEILNEEAIPEEKLEVPAVNEAPKTSSLADLILAEESEITSDVAGYENTSDVVLESPTVTKVPVEVAEETLTVDLEQTVDELNDAEHESEIAVVKAADIDPYERELLLEAMQSSIEIELQPEKNDEEPLPDDNSYAALIYRRSQRIQFTSESEKKSDHLKLEEEYVQEATTDWIRPTKEEIAENKQEEDFEEEGDLPAFDHYPLSHGSKKIQVADSKTHQRDLIDKFIRLEPNIARGKVAEYPTGNIAKESLEEDFSFITETMAQLFAKQGKMDKARKAYKKLIEQHPEKSIYFAAQLKNLDKLKK
jgi:hypothetical protein